VFLSNFRTSSPLHRRKTPYWRLSGDGSVWQLSGNIGLLLLVFSLSICTSEGVSSRDLVLISTFVSRPIFGSTVSGPWMLKFDIFLLLFRRKMHLFLVSSWWNKISPLLMASWPPLEKIFWLTLNKYYISPGRSGSRGGGNRPPKPAKVTLFTIILHNSENNIRDIRPFCRLRFCHNSVLKYRLLPLSYSKRSFYETWLPNITEIDPQPYWLNPSLPLEKIFPTPMLVRRSICSLEHVSCTIRVFRFAARI